MNRSIFSERRGELIAAPFSFSLEKSANRCLPGSLTSLRIADAVPHAH